jgi:hypothetical protein
LCYAVLSGNVTCSQHTTHHVATASQCRNYSSVISRESTLTCLENDPSQSRVYTMYVDLRNWSAGMHALTFHASRITEVAIRFKFQPVELPLTFMKHLRVSPRIDSREPTCNVNTRLKAQRLGYDKIGGTCFMHDGAQERNWFHGFNYALRIGVLLHSRVH